MCASDTVHTADGSLMLNDHEKNLPKLIFSLTCNGSVSESRVRLIGQEVRSRPTPPSVLLSTGFSGLDVVYSISSPVICIH